MNGPTSSVPAVAPKGASATIAMFETFTAETRAPVESTAVTCTVHPAGKSKSCGMDMSIFCATGYPARVVAYSPDGGKYA